MGRAKKGGVIEAFGGKSHLSDKLRTTCQAVLIYLGGGWGIRNFCQQKPTRAGIFFFFFVGLLKMGTRTNSK
jgi:hypothetical protein